MNFLRQTFSDWKYYASKDGGNPKRGFYAFTLYGFITLGILSILMCIASCVGLLAGALRIVGFLAPVIVLALLAAFIFVTRDK